MNVPGGRGRQAQRRSQYGASAATTIGQRAGAGGDRGAVGLEGVPVAGGERQVEANSRVCVDAATVVTQGPRWSVVPAPGPELPAEAATKTPAL